MKYMAFLTLLIIWLHPLMVEGLKYKRGLGVKSKSRKKESGQLKREGD